MTIIRPDLAAAPAVRSPRHLDAEQRIEAIDIVRGFALFGVLLVNMYNFGAYSAVWTDTEDRIAFSVMRFFFETKSWRLFAFLFGLGFSIQLMRAHARAGPFLPMYLRRLAALFVIGMGHALFYSGDILMLYAELGLVLLLFRTVPLRVVLALALVLIGVFPFGQTAETVATGRSANALASPGLPAARAQQEERLRTHPFAVGSLAEIIGRNAEAIPSLPEGSQLGPEDYPAIFALFLFGLYAGRRRIFHDVDNHLPLFRRAMRWGLTVGIAAMVTERMLAWRFGYAVFGPGRVALPVEFAGDLVFAYGSTALAFGYAATIVLLARNARFRRLVLPFGSAGRMALTVYLTHTLAFTTLFYPYGFGQAYRIGPAAVTAWAFVIFAIEVWACGWWLKRFHFGPLEWLWRSVTYLEFPRMRRVTSA